MAALAAAMHNFSEPAGKPAGFLLARRGSDATSSLGFRYSGCRLNRILRISILLLAFGAGGSASATDRDRGRNFEPGFGKRSPPAVVRAKGCEAYGQGFRPGLGTSSCIRVFGGVRTEIRSGQGLR